MPTMSELINALPKDDATGAADDTTVPQAPAAASLAPVPIGRLRRMGLLASLQAKIAAAYAFYWIRGWFKTASERERLAAETHWRTALRVLDSMTYLRGAAMKAPCGAYGVAIRKRGVSDGVFWMNAADRRLITSVE